jgi:hypothetical protein
VALFRTHAVCNMVATAVTVLKAGTYVYVSVIVYVYVFVCLCAYILKDYDTCLMENLLHRVTVLKAVLLVMYTHDSYISYMC